MKLEVNQWKPFKVASILSILNGKGITKDEIEENEGDFIVVQSGEENNGVLGKISLSYCKSRGYTYCEKPCLTVARSGSAGYVSFQVDGCVVGDSAKILLLSEDIATIERYVFIQTVLSANRFKYTYGRKVTETKYMNDVIDLLVKKNDDGTTFIDITKRFSTEGYIPDWEFMDSYIHSINYKPLTTSNIDKQGKHFEGWHEFRFGDLISNIYKAKAINKDELTISDNETDSIRYITRTNVDNGCELIASLVEVSQENIEDGNAITIGDTTATCFYQEEQFITGDHMVVVRAGWLNKYTGMFIVSLLTREQYKYSYGRAYLMDRIKDTMLKLPAIQENNKFVPDWAWMEKYIKSLPYGDRL